MPAMAWLDRFLLRVALPVMMAAGLSVLPGCIKGRIGGTMEADAVINELRQSNLDLQRQVQELQKTLEDRLAHIDTLNQQLKGAQPVAGTDVPRAVAISFDRFSGAVDTDGDQRDDLLRLYVKPHDQRGRLIPVAGVASIQVVAIRPRQEPVQVARLEVDAAQWEQAYRSGITGTHYTLELPLPRPLPAKVSELTVQVVVTDGATGAELSHQAIVPVK